MLVLVIDLRGRSSTFVTYASGMASRSKVVVTDLPNQLSDRLHKGLSTIKVKSMLLREVTDCTTSRM